jgi:subtilisin family serine protease
MALVRVLPFAFISIWAISISANAQVSGNINDDLEQRGEARIIVELKPLATGGGASAVAYLGAKLSGTSARISAIDPKTAVLRVDRGALERVQSDPRVSSVIRDDPIPAALNTAVPAIGGPSVWSSGHTGAGATVAVLDTGVDAAHPFLAGKVVKQACFSVDDPNASAKSLCPSGATLPDGAVVDLSQNAAVPCQIDGCEHGTHVAGIIAGNSVSTDGVVLSGVAKDAHLIVIQVFSRFDRKEDCFPKGAPCVLSFTSSQLRALQFVESQVLNRIATGQGPNIVAVNLSLGSGHNGANCDGGDNVGYARRLKALRDDGVATFIAAGNDGYPDGISFPACITSAIAVGAIEKPQTSTAPLRMADFSNRFEDKLVGLLTFGVKIKSSVPGGQYAEESGTSMATPLAAGAYAILADAFPNAGVDAILNVLRSTGAAVVDPFSQKTLPAIQLTAAYTKMASSAARAMATESKGPVMSDNSRPSDETNTRFLVTTTPGRAKDSAKAVQQSAEAIAKALKVGEVNVAPIGEDTLSLTTSSEVSVKSIADVLKNAAGLVGSVSVDRPSRTQ